MCVSVQYSVIIYSYIIIFSLLERKKNKNLDMSERFVISKLSSLHPDAVIKPSHPGKACSNISETFVGGDGYVGSEN